MICKKFQRIDSKKVKFIIHFFVKPQKISNSPKKHVVTEDGNVAND